MKIKYIIISDLMSFRKNKFGLVFFIFCLLLISNKTYSQSLAEKERLLDYNFPSYPKSPSTAIFSKYGEVQNSKYTGSNSPRINLYTIESPVMNIPLSLNYISGNGIKVNQEASNVGLGWMISLPTLIQTVMGKDDFDATHSTYKRKPDYLFNNLPYPSLLPTEYTAENSRTNPEFYNITNTINNSASPYSFGYFQANNYQVPICNHYSLGSDISSVTNTEPDIFVLNLFGERIEFSSYFTNCSDSFNPTSNFTTDYYLFKVLNKLDYKMEYVNSSIIITDNKGTKFYFSQKETIDDFHVGTKERNWYISKISDITNKEINFSYIEVPNIFNLNNSSQILNYTSSHNTEQVSTSIENDNFEMQSYCAATGCGKLSDYYAITKQNYLFINEIVFDSGRVKFEYSNREDNATKKLDFIKIYNLNNSEIKKINFNYDYFKTNSLSNDIPLSVSFSNIGEIYNYLDSYTYKRLKLLSLSINNNENYSFEYDPISLPRKISYAVDYWGFYNGASNNTSLIPNPNDFQNSTVPIISGKNDNNKKSNLNYAKAAILKKIIYPTKGYSEYEYEENEANNLFSTKNPSTILKGNGLRLLSQSNYDLNPFTVSKKTTNYLYEGGICMSPLVLVKNEYKQYYIQTLNYFYNTFLKGKMNVVSFHSNSISTNYPLSNGDFIGYSKVSEIQKGNGKNVNYFENNVGLLEAPMNIPNRKGGNKENGLINKEEVRDENNVLKSENIYTYDTFITPNISYGVKFKFTGIIRAYDNTTNQTYLSSVTEVGYYPIYSNKSFLTTKVSKEYFNSGIIESSTIYSYDSHKLLKYKSYYDYPINSEKNLIKTTRYDYPHDFSSPLMSLFKDFNCYDKLIGNQESMLEYKNYKYEKETILNTTKLEFTNDVFPLPKYIYSSKGANVLEKKLTYDFYDATGNLTQYTPEGGAPVTILWGYNKTQPIAKIENTTTVQLKNALGVSDLNAVNESNLSAINALRQGLPNAMVTTYTHIPLIGVSSITDPKGQTVFYNYDGLGRLKNVKDAQGNILSENEYHYKD
ncbi:MAG: hypothetical protein RLY43_2175 [Bacteroidota bacterium]